VKLDERDNASPGFKFNDWEMRGVPLRIELGPKDVAKNSVVLARRDRPGKEGKTAVVQAGLAAAVARTLDEIQQALFDRALAERRRKTFAVSAYGEFKSAVEQGLAYVFWCGNAACEEKIKAETKATLRCIPMEQEGGEGRCILCGGASRERAYFARAY
jgi:prolyl-tRNA synthetase